MALQTAYRQDDPEEGEIVGVRREPPSCGTESELNEAVADSEAKLKEQRNDFRARYTRLRTLTRLAYRRRREAEKGTTRCPLRTRHQRRLLLAGTDPHPYHPEPEFLEVGGS